MPIKSNKSKYLKLSIDRDQLYITLIAFFIEKNEEYTCSEIFEKAGGRKRVEYTFNDCSEIIDFHFNGDGSTTIDLTPGGKSELKEEIAEFIYNSPICHNKDITSIKDPWFLFNSFNHEEFQVLIDLLLENENVQFSNRKDIPGGALVEIKSTYGEKIKITYFHKNKKLMVQGKPLKLFSEAYTFAMSLVDTKQIPEIMSQQMNISKEITLDSIKGELGIYLSNINLSEYPEKMKKLSYQALMNLKINEEMFDYVFLAYPSLRLIEGHLKYIMKDKGITLENRKFSMFKKIQPGNLKVYELCSEYHSLFTKNQKKYVENAYNYYANNRHELFHWGDLDTPLFNRDDTKLFSNPTQAHGCIHDVFSIINEYHA